MAMKHRLLPDKVAKPRDDEDVEAWLDNLDPDVTPARDAHLLADVGRALTAVEEAEAALRAAIQKAVEGGETWGMIGMVLGTSRQAAHKRFAPKPSKREVVKGYRDGVALPARHAKRRAS